MITSTKGIIRETVLVEASFLVATFTTIHESVFNGDLHGDW